MLTIPAVNPENVGAAIDELRDKLAAVCATPTQVHASFGADGAYEITVTGSGSRPTVVEAWLSAVNWFDHTKETLLFGYRDADVKTDSDGRSYVLKPALGSDGLPYIDANTGWWAFAEDIAANRVYVGGWLDASWESPYDTAGDTDSDGQDKARTHALTTEQRSVNEDGTFDSRVSEETPHKRYWTWDDQQAQGRKKRTVNHKVWRNWPSRKNLASDIVGTVGDNQVDVSISINKYGLVDATRTEAPAWRNVTMAQGATFTESAEITWSEIEKAYRKPAQAGLSDTPADGYYWRVVSYTATIGRTSGGATDAATHCSGGKAGSKIWPERQSDVDSIGSVWAWKKVTAITPGAWQAGVLQQ